MSTDDKIRHIESRLTNLDKEKTELLSELRKLRAESDDQKSVTELGRPVLNKPPETNEEKSNLFISLFRSRENVYPKRWEKCLDS